MPTILTSLFTDLEAGRQYRVNVFTGSPGGSPIEVKTVALSREVGRRNLLPTETVFIGSIKWTLLVENETIETAVESLFGANVLDTFIEVRIASSNIIVYRSFLNTEHFTSSLKAYPTEIQLIGTDGLQLLDSIPYVPLGSVDNLLNRSSRFAILRQALSPINDAYNFGYSIVDPISEDNITVPSDSTPLATEFIHDVVYEGMTCREVLDDILTTKGLTLKLEFELGQMRWCLFNYDAYRTADEETFTRRIFASDGSFVDSLSNMLLVEPSCFENNPIQQFTPFFGDVRLRFDNDIDLSRFFGGRTRLFGTPPVVITPQETFEFLPVFEGEADNGQALVRDRFPVISKDEDYRLALSLRLNTFRNIESNQPTTFTTPYRLRCEIKWIGESQTYYLKGVNTGYTWETTPELAEFIVDFRPVANKEINILSPVIPETGSPELSIFTIDNVAQEDVTDPITNQTITINQIDAIEIDKIVLQATDEDGDTTKITGRTYVGEGSQGRSLNLGTVITGDLPKGPEYLGAIYVDDGTVFRRSEAWSLAGADLPTPIQNELSGVELLKLQVTSVAQTFGTPTEKTFVTFKTDQIVRSINLIRVPSRSFITYFEFDYVTSRCTVESIPINRFPSDSLVVDEQATILPFLRSQPAIPEIPGIELPIKITDVEDLNVSIDETDGTLQDGIVTETKIANDAVSSDKIADLSISTAKIQNEAIRNDKVLSIDFDKVSRSDDDPLIPKTIVLDEFFDFSDFDKRVLKNTVEVESDGGVGTLSKRVSSLDNVGNFKKTDMVDGEEVAVEAGDGAVGVDDGINKVEIKRFTGIGLTQGVGLVYNNTNDGELVQLFQQFKRLYDAFSEIEVVLDQQGLLINDIKNDRRIALKTTGIEIKGDLQLVDNTVISGKTINAVENLGTLDGNIDDLDLTGTFAKIKSPDSFTPAVIRGIQGGVEGRTIEITVTENLVQLEHQSSSVTPDTRRIITKTGSTRSYQSALTRTNTIILRYINSRWHEISNP